MCEHEETVDIIEIYDGIKLIIHYNADLEPVCIQYMDDSKCLNKNFTPKHDLQFKEIGKFKISMDDIKNENFDLTDIIKLDE